MTIYKDLAETLRQQIRDGEHPDGRLPIQPDLAAEFGVGLATVHRALAVLKADGTIYTTHAGTFAGPRSEGNRT